MNARRENRFEAALRCLSKAEVHTITDRKEKVVEEGRKEGENVSQELGGSSADLRGRTRSAKPEPHEPQ